MRIFHFGQQKTSCFGNKSKYKFLLFALVLSLFFSFISCGGKSYTFTFTLEELEQGLESIEVVSILDFGNPLVCESLYLINDEQERGEILEKISKIEFDCVTVPRSTKPKYGFKLNYADKCIVLGLRHIFITDKNLNYYGKIGHTLYIFHELRTTNDILIELLSKYVTLEEE